MLLVRINDVAAAEFQQDFALQIAMRLFDRRRIGESDSFTVVTDADFVPVVGRQAFSC